MTKAGRFILSVIASVAVMAAIAFSVETISKMLSPWRVYDCDFRLISRATCNLPMAAHTIRIPMWSVEIERAERVALRDRIIACEREKTAKRRNGEPVSARRCWDEGLAPEARISSR